MATFTIGLGVDGTLTFQDGYKTSLAGRLLQHRPGKHLLARRDHCQHGYQDRRPLARGGQWPRHLLQRPRSRVSGHRAQHGARRHEERQRLGGSGGDQQPAADCRRQLHLRGHLPDGELGRRIVRLYHRPLERRHLQRHHLAGGGLARRQDRSDGRQRYAHRVYLADRR